MRYRAFTTNSIRDFATTSSSKEGNVSSSQDDNVLQALGTGARSNERMMIAFTCNVCETRSARMFSKKSYEEGVVIITCPECKSNHLIADRLGWFDDESVDIETIMREKGQEIIHIKDSDGGGVIPIGQYTLRGRPEEREWMLTRRVDKGCWLIVVCPNDLQSDVKSRAGHFEAMHG
eukprot:CAMPEP_0185264038 /NCGR_PEP_ID=MMETSP1359-20130426/17055_1 /TAXON_ID=552665 /ORGANISM="Bigelowiella longifila, Strain CCMP242" /LENGTH=176 /DNA_ID=CAMNT_0027851999 /DNA_START=371 /DNA_END=900 /DNA_ORIENTATION=+